MVELKKGDFFTVEEWKNIKSSSFIGDCMEVLVIDGSFENTATHQREETKTCPMCDGEKYINFNHNYDHGVKLKICPECQGTGKVTNRI